MKKEEFPRYKHHRSVVKNYLMPRINGLLSLTGIVVFTMLLNKTAQDSVSFSSDLLSFILKLFLGLSIFSSLVTIFIKIPSGSKRHEYFEAKARLKIIETLAEE